MARHWRVRSLREWLIIHLERRVDKSAVGTRGATPLIINLSQVRAADFAEPLTCRS